MLLRRTMTTVLTLYSSFIILTLPIFSFFINFSNICRGVIAESAQRLKSDPSSRQLKFIEYTASSFYETLQAKNRTEDPMHKFRSGFFNFRKQQRVRRPKMSNLLKEMWNSVNSEVTSLKKAKKTLLHQDYHNPELNFSTWIPPGFEMDSWVATNSMTLEEKERKRVTDVLKIVFLSARTSLELNETSSDSQIFWDASFPCLRLNDTSIYVGSKVKSASFSGLTLRLKGIELSRSSWGKDFHMDLNLHLPGLKDKQIYEFLLFHINSNNLGPSYWNKWKVRLNGINGWFYIQFEEDSDDSPIPIMNVIDILEQYVDTNIKSRLSDILQNIPSPIEYKDERVENHPSVIFTRLTKDPYWNRTGLNLTIDEVNRLSLLPSHALTPHNPWWKTLDGIGDLTLEEYENKNDEQDISSRNRTTQSMDNRIIDMAYRDLTDKEGKEKATEAESDKSSQTLQKSTSSFLQFFASSNINNHSNHSYDSNKRGVPNKNSFQSANSRDLRQATLPNLSMNTYQDRVAYVDKVSENHRSTLKRRKYPTIEYQVQLFQQLQQAALLDAKLRERETLLPQEIEKFKNVREAQSKKKHKTRMPYTLVSSSVQQSNSSNQARHLGYALNEINEIVEAPCPLCQKLETVDGAVSLAKNFLLGGQLQLYHTKSNNKDDYDASIGYKEPANKGSEKVFLTSMVVNKMIKSFFCEVSDGVIEIRSVECHSSLSGRFRIREKKVLAFQEWLPRAGLRMNTLIETNQIKGGNNATITTRNGSVKDNVVSKKYRTTKYSDPFFLLNQALKKAFATAFTFDIQCRTGVLYTGSRKVFPLTFQASLPSIFLKSPFLTNVELLLIDIKREILH